MTALFRSSIILFYQSFIIILFGQKKDCHWQTIQANKFVVVKNQNLEWKMSSNDHIFLNRLQNMLFIVFLFEFQDNLSDRFQSNKSMGFDNLNFSRFLIVELSSNKRCVLMRTNRADKVSVQQR